MDFLIGLVLHVLVNVSAIKPVHPGQEAYPPKAKQTMAARITRSKAIPRWVTKIPDGCFVGVSRPHQSIQDARRGALGSATSQILQAMGAECRLEHRSTLIGTENSSHHEIRETLSYKSEWFLRSVQQNIKELEIQQIRERYICFVLVNFPQSKIERLRKLTAGPNLAARILGIKDEALIIEVRENNGVQVTLTHYQMELEKEHRHAGLITLFLCKVPKGSHRQSGGVLDETISVKGTSETFHVPNLSVAGGLKEFVMGTETQLKILLHGYDEMGRQVRLTVKSP